jgi:hypothetical protein
VDHIVPRAVVPELDNVIANLERRPLRANERKNDRIGERQHNRCGHNFSSIKMVSGNGVS